MEHKRLLSFVYIVAFLFIASSVYAAQSAVNLGTAGNFVILAKSGISTTGTTAITGNIGVSPAAATFITGFGLIMDSSNTFSTSSLITGKVYAADYTPPTPSLMTTAISDMQTAYTAAAGRTLPDHTELGAGNIGGMTLSPGLYKWGTGVTIPTDVTLSGGANDVWVFQIAQTLNIASGKQVILKGGAQAKNIFWQVAGQTTLGTTSVFNGNILDQTAIVLNTGATLNGRALAQTAVTLDASDVSLSAGSSIPPSIIPPVKTPPSGEGSSGSGTSGSGSSSSGSSGGSAINWNCGEWSACVSGVRTKLCTRPNSVVTSTEKQSCSPIVKNTTSNKTNENNQVRVETEQNKTQTNQGIGQALNQQIMAIKEGLKSGDYNGSLGQLMNVRQLAQDLRELRVNNSSAQTDLNITADTDRYGKTTFRTTLRNGTEIEIKMMPDTASARAIQMLGLNSCSPSNNCTIQLKDVGNGASEKAQYEVQLYQDSKILGIFNKKMHVSANVDANTGATTIHRPWWSFAATT